LPLYILPIWVIELTHSLTHYSSTHSLRPEHRPSRIVKIWAETELQFRETYLNKCANTTKS